MAKTGLTRLPYYPQLSVLFKDGHGPQSLVLSALLFWQTRDEKCRFQKKMHLYQLALHLKLSVKQVSVSLDELEARGLAYSYTESLPKLVNGQVALNADGSVQYLNRTYLQLNLVKLAYALQEAGESALQVRLLRHAADDNFELYDILNKERLPLTQYLKGTVAGTAYDAACLRCAQLACQVTARNEDFAHRAIAPGWRMLLQPPAQAQDIASRWTREGERAIDMEFADGTIFLPDNDCFGAQTHRIAHRGKAPEARILAAAFLMAASCECDSLTFCSELPLEEIYTAAQVLHTYTGLKAKLSNEFCQARQMDESASQSFLQDFKAFMDAL